MAKQKSKANFEPRIENRRAYHDYLISDKVECGIVLTGSEVKSIRAGRVNLTEGYADINPRTGELWLLNVEISAYAQATNRHLPRAQRKLLAHKREIARLAKATACKGTTLIPLAMYFKEGRIKVEIGLASGKKEHDKRAASREKDVRKDLQRAMMVKKIG